MSESEDLPDDGVASDALPRHTTPTWEVELLISGVAVFAMLQLPGLLDDAIFAVRPRFGEAWASLLVPLYLYSKSAAVILAVTFVAHLLLRARWIALVGLHSIDPRGIDWERMRLGPLTRMVESERMGRIEDCVERADNRATTVFAIGVMLASILLRLTLLVALLLALAGVTGSAPSVTPVLVLFAVIVAPYAAIQLADRHFGARLAPGGRARRLLVGTIGLYSRIGMGLASNPAMAMLSSQGGRRRMVALVMSLMMLAIFGVSGAYYALREPGRFGSYSLLPDEDMPGMVTAAYYADQRDPARDRPTPYIQSDVIAGPYLKLVVPYEPIRDEPALRRNCPGLAIQPQVADTTTALDCLRSLRAVKLDGKPLTTLRYDLGSDPPTNRPALVAMIDLREVPRGRHLLQVARPVVAPDNAPTHELPFVRIPFWR